MSDRPTYTFDSDPATLYNAITSVIGSDSDFGRIAKQFATKNAGKTLNAYGINLAWEFAVYEISTPPGAVPFMSGMLDFQFEDVMTALVTDESVRAQIFEARRKVREDAS